jgi:hypothetical protein
LLIAITKLDPLTQDVIWDEREGCTLAESAERNGLSIWKVRELRRHGLEKLRRIFFGEG